MTNARRLFAASSAFVMALAVSGCMSSGGGSSGPGGSPGRAAATGVEGAWIDAQGTGLSTLSGGVFQTVATDTGQKLAEGSYVLNNATSVQINGTSLIRGAPIAFNCLLVSTSQLNCTSGAGQQFVLNRRA